MHHLPFVTGPCPALYFIGPSPITHTLFTSISIGGMHSYFNFTSSPYHIPVMRLGLLFTNKIYISTISIIPRPWHQLITFLILADCMANPCFAQVVHCRPYKIADDVRVFFNKVPVLKSFLRN